MFKPSKMPQKVNKIFTRYSSFSTHFSKEIFCDLQQTLGFLLNPNDWTKYNLAFRTKKGTTSIALGLGNK